MSESTKVKNILMAGVIPLFVSAIIALFYGIATNTLDTHGMTFGNWILEAGAAGSLIYYVGLSIYIYLPEKLRFWDKDENKAASKDNQFLNYKDRNISLLDAEALIYSFTTSESITQDLIKQIETKDIPHATMLREVHERDKISWQLDKLLTSSTEKGEQ